MILYNSEANNVAEESGTGISKTRYSQGKENSERFNSKHRLFVTIAIIQAI